MIFDENLDIYNYKYSKNNPDTEVTIKKFSFFIQERLSKIMETFNDTPKFEEMKDDDNDHIYSALP